MNREETIEQFKYAIDLIKQDGKDYLDERDIPMLEMGIKALENQKTGHWIDNKVQTKLCNCSECNALSRVYTKYCPNCGAKMEGEKLEGSE